MNIAAIQTNRTHEVTSVVNNERKGVKTSFSNFLNSQIMTSTNSKRELIQQQENLVDSTNQILTSIDEGVMEKAGESFSAFLEGLVDVEEDSKEMTEEDTKEIISIIQSLQIEPEQLSLASISKSEISQLLELLPQEIKTEIELFLNSFSSSTNPISISEEILKPENILNILILLTQVDNESMKKLDESSFTKLLEFVKKQLEGFDTNSIIPKNTDVELVEKKVQQLIQQLFAKELKEQPNQKLEHSTRKEYLQSVFSRYFTEPNGMKSSLQQQFNSAIPNMQTISQTPVKADTAVQPIIGSVDVQAPMNKIQQFMLFVEHNGKQTVNQEQFIKEFQNIISRSQFGSTQDGQQKLLIKLYPEHLGSLRIEILQKDNMMIARIIASTAAAKDVLESQVQNLKQSFQSQNIQVEKVEISHQQGQQPERFLQKDSQSNQERSQNQRESDKQDETEPNSSFVASLQEEILNLKV